MAPAIQQMAKDKIHRLVCRLEGSSMTFESKTAKLTSSKNKALLNYSVPVAEVLIIRIKRDEINRIRPPLIPQISGRPQGSQSGGFSISGKITGVRETPAAKP